MFRTLAVCLLLAQVTQIPDCGDDNPPVPAGGVQWDLGFDASGADFNCTGFVRETVTLVGGGAGQTVTYANGDGPYPVTQTAGGVSWVRNWIGGGVHTVEQVTIDTSNLPNLSGSSVFTKEFVNSGLSPCSGTSSITGQEL